MNPVLKDNNVVFPRRENKAQLEGCYVKVVYCRPLTRWVIKTGRLVIVTCVSLRSVAYRLISLATVTGNYCCLHLWHRFLGPSAQNANTFCVAIFSVQVIGIATSQ